MNLVQLATLLNSTLEGANAEFDSVSIDTRTLTPGQLFLALQGPNFDGNQFIAEAAKKGAVGAVVSDPKLKTTLPLIRVQDTKKALTELAKHQRQQVHIPIVAVTGSSGKTTTRSMIASVLRQVGNVLASESSFNNDIGVPLTLLRLQANHDYAVFELGANHPGEIDYLSQLVKPTIAMITNAGPAHLAGFGDVAGVARAKGELFSNLSSEGTAIVNLEDAHADFWQGLIKSKKIITFGRHNNATVSARAIKIDQDARPTFELVVPTGSITVSLPLMGEHNVMNALAAAAVGYALAIPMTAIKAGLESVSPVKGRLVGNRGYGGAMIIDDSYNANPASVTAAIRVLAEHQGDAVLVLGDMLELGEASEALHRDIGKTALQNGIKQLYGFGPYTRHATEAFGQQGYHFESKQSLISALKNQLNDKVTVLVKGSRSMDMTEVANALLKDV